MKIGNLVIKFEKRKNKYEALMKRIENIETVLVNITLALDKMSKR